MLIAYKFLPILPPDPQNARGDNWVFRRQIKDPCRIGRIDCVRVEGLFSDFWLSWRRLLAGMTGRSRFHTKNYLSGQPPCRVLMSRRMKVLFLSRVESLFLHTLTVKLRQSVTDRLILTLDGATISTRVFIKNGNATLLSTCVPIIVKIRRYPFFSISFFSKKFVNLLPGIYETIFT